MRDSYRRYLMTLGLGTALSVLPHVPSVLADTSVPVQPSSRSAPEGNTLEASPQENRSQVHPAPATVAQAVNAGDAVLPQVNLDQLLTPVVAPPLEAAEQPVPLTEEETSLPLEGEGATPADASPAAAPPTEQPADLPTVQDPNAGSPVITGVPDYLNPAPNPLLLPVSPEEVDVVGSEPISLETAIDLAYRNNEDLQRALLELERSQSVLREAQAGLYPTVDLGAGLTARESEQTSVSIFGPTTSSEVNTTLTGEVQVNYDLYTGGRRDAQIRAAEEQVRLNELEVERRRAQLRLDTTTEYYALQAAVEEIRIAQAFLTEAERNLQDAALREEVGVGTRFDVLRAEVQVANARQSLVQAQSNQLTNQRRIAQRLNLPPNINVDALSVEVAGAWPLTLEDSIILAFQNRAELEQQLVQREINEQQRRIALSQQIPQVGLFAAYNLQDVLDAEDGDGFTDSLSVGAQLRWNIFDGGATQARAEQRERDIEISERQFAETRNFIRFEVEQAYFDLQANQQNIDTAKLAVEQAREALDLAILRFNAGVGTQLDVLTTTRELTEAEANLVRAILGYNNALASLERAVSNLPEVDTGSARY